MTQHEILTFVSNQSVPPTDDQITGCFGLEMQSKALCENSLLDMLHGGWLCEPRGEFKGWALTDAGRDELKRLTTPEPKKREQLAMF